MFLLHVNLCICQIVDNVGSEASKKFFGEKTHLDDILSEIRSHLDFRKSMHFMQAWLLQPKCLQFECLAQINLRLIWIHLF